MVHTTTEPNHEQINTIRLKLFCSTSKLTSRSNIRHKTESKEKEQVEEEIYIGR